METIKNYLETMFANMPNTVEVQKAKAELFSMMEDKYNELISEGKSENEAVGTVISEFGNLDEIAGDLGISEVYEEEKYYSVENPRRKVSFMEVKDYLKQCENRAFLIAMGVLLCIFSVIPPIIADAYDYPEKIGVLLMFSLIAVAVGLFVFSGVIYSSWDFLKKEACSIDFDTAKYLESEQGRYRTTHALRLTLGIVLCVICWLPAAMFDNGIKQESLGASMLFILVGVGVFLIVFTSIINGNINDLLNLNDATRVSGSYGKDNEIQYINQTVTALMSVYWSIIGCAYIAYSFLTFNWATSWIIWPVAGIVKCIIDKMLVKQD